VHPRRADPAPDVDLGEPVGDNDPDLTKYLRIEERELEAGGLN
jgi:hypothetical protein